MPRYEQSTTIAILGSNSVPEQVLAHLLEREGYAVRFLKAPSTGAPTLVPEDSRVNELLEGVEVVLVWPSLRDGTREAFLGAMRSSPTTAAVPALAISPTLKAALQDELAVDVPLERQFEHLTRKIEATLSAEAS